LEDRFVVTPQQERPFLSGIVVRDPFDFVPSFRVPDSVTIRAKFARPHGIIGLRFRASAPSCGWMLSREVPIQFLDLRHKI
jgi:hypothetical protein